MLLPILLLTLPPTLSSPLLSHQTFSLTITNFSAFMANPYIDGAQSNLTFHVSDPRPGLELSVSCIVPPTFFNLYAISALGDNCGTAEERARGVDVSYTFGERTLSVRRGWKVNETSYLTASATQSTGWSETGPEKNVTVYPDGKLFAREAPWEFPVSRVQVGTPP